MGDRTPDGAISPAFRRDTIVMMVCSFWAIGVREDAFVEGFELDRRKILSVDLALNESASYW